MVDVSGTNFNPWVAIGSNAGWNAGINNWQNQQAQQLATWQAPQQEVFNNFGRQTDYYSALGADYGRNVGGDWSGYGSGVSLYGEPYTAPQAQPSYAAPSYDYSYQQPSYDFSYLYNQPSYYQPQDLGPSYGYTAPSYDYWSGGAPAYQDYSQQDLSSYYGGAGTYGSWNYDSSPWYSAYSQPAADYSYQQPSYDFSYLYNQPAASTPSYDYSGWGRGATSYDTYGQPDLSSYYGGAGTYNSWNYDPSSWYDTTSAANYTSPANWGDYNYAAPSYDSSVFGRGSSVDYTSPDYSSIYGGYGAQIPSVGYNYDQFMPYSEPWQSYGMRGVDFSGSYDDLTAQAQPPAQPEPSFPGWGARGMDLSGWGQEDPWTGGFSGVYGGGYGGVPYFNESTGIYGNDALQRAYDQIRGGQGSTIADQVGNDPGLAGRINQSIYDVGNAGDYYQRSMWGGDTGGTVDWTGGSNPWLGWGTSGEAGRGGWNLGGSEQRVFDENSGIYGTPTEILARSMQQQQPQYPVGDPWGYGVPDGYGAGWGGGGGASPSFADRFGTSTQGWNVDPGSGANPYYGLPAEIMDPQSLAPASRGGGQPGWYFDDSTGQVRPLPEFDGGGGGALNFNTGGDAGAGANYPAWANYNGTSYGGEPAIDPLVLQRAEFRDRFLNNPDLAARLNTELGRDSEGRTAIVEAMLNRLAATGQDPFNPAYFDVPLSVSRARLDALGPEKYQQIYGDIARAFEGSNLSKGATDWASLGVADDAEKYSTKTWTSPTENERFFRKDISNDYAGAGIAARNQAWWAALNQPWLGQTPWRSYGYPPYYDPTSQAP